MYQDNLQLTCSCHCIKSWWARQDLIGYWFWLAIVIFFLLETKKAGNTQGVKRTNIRILLVRENTVEIMARKEGSFSCQVSTKIQNPGKIMCTIGQLVWMKNGTENLIVHWFILLYLLLPFINILIRESIIPSKCKSQAEQGFRWV